MHWLTELFIFALISSSGVQWWLSHRQIRNVSAHRDEVPAPFADRISVADHTKAADYTIACEQLGQVELILDALVLVLLTLGGGISWIDSLWGGAGLGQPWFGTAVILSVIFLQSIIALPLTLYKTFRVEAHFGFNRMTPGLFAIDLLKSYLLGLALGAPLIALILYLMDRAGALWWLYAWLALTLFSIGIQWAYPAIIAPWFNKFVPLADAALQSRIGNLLQRCGFKAQGVFVMDGSKRSAHGNAYFTGFGKNKRVVFFDTLLERLTPGEIEGVLAHELGHFRRHHIRNRLFLSVLMTLVGFALLGWLFRWPEFYSAFGIEMPASHSALLLFMLVLGPFTFWLTPLGAWWSRRHEFEADAFAAEHASGDELAVALTKLFRDNASTLTPDDIHSAFYDSHPPALIRIAHLHQLANSATTTAASEA